MTPPQEVIATIAVVCDDRRHPRKVPLVTELSFYADGEWTRHTPRGRRYARLTEQAQAGRDVRIARLTTLFGNDPIQCKLCARRLPSDQLIRQSMDRLVALGVSRLTLSDLSAIVNEG